MYLALEPFVRRYWPRSLISWTRVLSGRIYDPLVGKHILVGVAIAVSMAAIARVGMTLNGGRHLSTTVGEPSVLILLGGRHMASQLSFYVSDLLTKSMTVLFLVFLLKVLLRNTGIAIIAATLLMTAAFAGTGTGDPVVRAAVMGTGTALMMTGLARFGFLPIVVGALATSMLVESPVTYRISAWYSSVSFTVLAITIALTLFGFFAATVSTRRTGRLSAVDA
jgi:serine/threonine-protein kinase